VDFVIVRFLMKLFNIITWTLSIIIDYISLLNYLVLSGLIVSEGLRKSLPKVTIFFAKFQSQFDILYLSLSSVSILSAFSLFSCLFDPECMTYFNKTYQNFITRSTRHWGHFEGDGFKGHGRKQRFGGLYFLCFIHYLPIEL